MRVEAKSVLIGAWHHGSPLVREVILKKLLQKVPVLPSYGQNITDYTDLLTWILGMKYSKPMVLCMKRAIKTLVELV